MGFETPLGPIQLADIIELRTFWRGVLLLETMDV